MKKMLYLLVMVLSFSNIAHAATFYEGDSGTLYFSSLPYIGIGDNNYMDQTLINFPFPTIIIGPSGTSEFIPFLTEDDSFQINLFENKDDLIPAYVELLDGLNGTPQRIGFTRPISFYLDGTISYGSLLWEDLEGKLTWTMLSGSMNLDFFDVEVNAGGQIWGQSFEVLAVPTPIPGAAWLMGSGLLGLVGLRKKTQSGHRK
ncbi:MAG: hypothetical protein MUO63_04935 [Desulfobulbaceae bacterium]|nr:hypothetical protein [Desulfobulbaceae bacterium]